MDVQNLYFLLILAAVSFRLIFLEEVISDLPYNVDKTHKESLRTYKF